MSNSKWEKGKVYLTKKGEEFVYLGEAKLAKQFYHLIRFTSSDNYQYVHSCVLNNPSRLRDSSLPHIAGVGYARGTKDKPFAPHLNPKAYEIWCAMINRCYHRGSGIRSYKDVEVSEEWYDFNNFLAWYKKEVYDESIISRYELALDKDLLGGGSRVYSAETCCFLPKSINSILVGMNFEDFTRESARRVYHLEMTLSSYGKILTSKVRELLVGKVNAFRVKYYKLVGFTPEQLFADEFKEEVSLDLGKISVYGFLEYKKSVYKFYSLKELKDFVETLENEEKADNVEKIHKDKLMPKGRHRKLIA